MSSGPYWCHDCETEHSSKCPWDVVKDKDKEIERLRLENDNAKAAIEQARDALAGWGEEDE